MGVGADSGWRCVYYVHYVYVSFFLKFLQGRILGGDVYIVYIMFMLVFFLKWL